MTTTKTTTPEQERIEAIHVIGQCLSALLKLREYGISSIGTNSAIEDLRSYLKQYGTIDFTEPVNTNTEFITHNSPFGMKTTALETIDIAMNNLAALKTYALLSPGTVAAYGDLKASQQQLHELLGMEMTIQQNLKRGFLQRFKL